MSSTDHVVGEIIGADFHPEGDPDHIVVSVRVPADTKVRHHWVMVVDVELYRNGQPTVEDVQGIAALDGRVEPDLPSLDELLSAVVEPRLQIEKGGQSAAVSHVLVRFDDYPGGGPWEGRTVLFDQWLAMVHKNLQRMREATGRTGSSE